MEKKIIIDGNWVTMTEDQFKPIQDCIDKLISQGFKVMVTHFTVIGIVKN